MTALLVTLALFAGWSLIGLALLTLVRADTSQLRIVLTAPALGTCVTLLFVFPFSEAGMAVEHCAVPVAIFLMTATGLILLLRRPPVHPGALLVAATCVGGLLLVSGPMFSFGFGWLANGNEDMSNYVLSAQDLLHHGLLSAVDVEGLLHGRDYATALAELHKEGARPGSDMLLAFASRVFERPTYQMFMPAIVAFNLSGASAVGALALQFARRWWAAAIAAALLLISPMATFGMLQQLLAQVLGLGVVAALFALLMRPELHRGRGASLREVVPIFVLATGLILSYLELVPEMGLAYLLYVAVLGIRKKLALTALIRLWLPVVALAVILLNAYFFTELHFLKLQSEHGLSEGAYAPLFGYVKVPSGLPGILGMQTLPPGFGAPHLDLTIVVALVAIAGLVVVCIAGTVRGVAAAVVLAVEGMLAIELARKNSDFGIFKLTMYLQPFLAALLAISLASIRRPTVAVACTIPIGLLLAAQLSTQHAYVQASRDPSVAPNLSGASFIPAFHAAASHATTVVSVTTNPVVVKLEAAAAEGRQTYFLGRDVFAHLLPGYGAKEGAALRSETVTRELKEGPWRSRTFNLPGTNGANDSFEEDEQATLSLMSGQCTLVVPGVDEEPLNHYSLPGASSDLATIPCRASHDLLAFTSSKLGENFYLPLKLQNISYFPLQPDPFYPGRSLVGFGRYALFQVLGWEPGSRLELSFTATLNHNGDQLPPASVRGSSRVALPVLGRGAARVFSQPVTPQMINGIPYLLVDMGVEARLPLTSRPGIQGLYGRSVSVDPRYLTSYVRDISLVSPQRYARLRPPLVLRSFPADLENEALEYSGIYEDGWMAADSYVRLAGGPKANLIVRGEVPNGAGEHVTVLVDSKVVTSVPVSAGSLDLQIPVAASNGDRRVELRFAKTIRLRAPDLRPAAIFLRFLGLTPPMAGPGGKNARLSSDDRR